MAVAGTKKAALQLWGVGRQPKRVMAEGADSPQEQCRAGGLEGSWF